MSRRSDWQLQLMQYVATRAREPVDLNAPVCTDFVAGAVMAMTDDTRLTPWIGQYATVTAGLKALRRAGYADHVEFVAAHFDEVPVALAEPGDIAVVPVPGDLAALGIVQGAAIYVQSNQGVGAVPLTAAVRTFRVS